jgi:glucosylceramidase
MLIPFIKDAIEQAKTPIQIMASPWSPPAWMKTNGQMNHGGKLKEEFRDAWATYYCKYINAYEKEGIPIWGISVQNEPTAKQTWDSCIYTAEEERDFIRDYLGPTLENSNLLDKKVIIWDHNRNIMVERARTVLNDPEAAKYVWGTGFHWYNGDHFDAVQQVHDEFPDKELIFTEGCQENGPHIGSWDLGERYATSIINDLNRWTVAWIDWNLILDENGGPNHVGNYCSAPIIVDTNTQEILYQSSYYYLGHFSRFIKRGDKIIGCECKTDDLLALASINDSGITTTIVMNKKNTQENCTYMNGEVILDLCIPSRSIVTLINV